MSKVTVDDKDFQDLIKELKRIPVATMKEAYPFYKEKTPIRHGNARNKTKLRKTTINSDYGYAGKLDDGWSKQSPQGFTKPTIDRIEDIVDNFIKRI